MADHSRIAFSTGHHPSAAVIGARDVVGIPPAIQEKHHLAPAVKRAFDGAAEAGADQPDPGLVEISTLFGEVDDLDRRKGQAGGSFRKTMDGASGGSGCVVPTFEGRRRRAQDHRAIRELSAANGHIPSLIPRGLILFVRRIMFLIDDDEAEPSIGNRREHGRSGS